MTIKSISGWSGAAITRNGSTGKALLRLLGLTVVNGGMLSALTPFAYLREDPMFWRNAGGWPIWLRELVLTTFYPLLTGEACLLVALSMLCLHCPILGRSRQRILPIAGTMWLWAAAIVLLVVNNNVTNVLAGRPLHWHAN